MRTRCISRREGVLRYAIPAAFPAAELRRHEFRHVGDGGGQTGCRGHAASVDEGEHLAGSVGHSPPVTRRHLRVFPIDARCAHPERIEDILLEIVGPAHAGDLLDHHSCDRVREVRVLPTDFRRERGLALGHQLFELGFRREVEIAPMGARFAGQARAVGQQVLDGDGRIVRRRGPKLEPRQILGDRIVEPDSTLLAELHDRGRGEELAVGRHAKPRVELHGATGVDVRAAETPRPDQILIRDDADDDTRQLADRDLTIEPGREQADLRFHVGIVGGGRRRKGGRDAGRRQQAGEERQLGDDTARSVHRYLPLRGLHGRHVKGTDGTGGSFPNASCRISGKRTKTVADE
jgi:hypothetical protein